MTKEQFKELATVLIEQCIELPDDLWLGAYPTVSAILKEPDGTLLKVTVGFDEAEPDEEESEDDEI